jgi:hypothetical protein
MAVSMYCASNRGGSAQAKATPSWWFCAHGFTEVLDPHGLVERFLSSLDRALDAENAM